MSVWPACRQEVGGPSLQQLSLHLTEREETPRINLLAPLLSQTEPWRTRGHKLGA